VLTFPIALGTKPKPKDSSGLLLAVGVAAATGLILAEGSKKGRQTPAKR